MLTGLYWPIHLKPQSDELLTSWLQRLAASHGLKLQQFSRVLSPGANVWNRDIDAHTPDSLLSLVASRTGVPYERAWQTSLLSLEGVLFDRASLTDATPWILPIGMANRRRVRFGLQYCPECIRELHYLRRSWRLGTSFVCVRHRLWLESRCSCGSPFEPHRRELGLQAEFDATISARCNECRRPLRAVIPATPSYCRAQGLLDDLLRHRGIELGAVQIPSAEFFAGIRLIATAAVFGIKAESFAFELAERTSSELVRPSKSFKLRRFEDLDARARGELLRAILRLLPGWPESFVEVCEQSGMWASYWCRWSGMPQWLESVLDRFLIARGRFVRHVPRVRSYNHLELPGDRVR